MKLSPGDISGVIDIMNRLYREILAVEEEFGLQFGSGDFRPRIEYFHDAVREFTASTAGAYGQGGRLSVEMLAYDLTCLRYIQSMPLASFNKNDRPLSVHQQVLKQNENLPAAPKAKPDRTVKIRLTELYQQYGVLFSALFKPHADHNYHERTEAMNEEVKQMSAVLQLMQRGASEQQVLDAIAHMDNAEFRQLLFNMLRNKKHGDAIPAIKDETRKTDQAIANLDAAHLQYASGHLALFEDGKDVVKALAAKGMNLAGKFVESAMKAARTEKGRGGR